MRENEGMEEEPELSAYKREVVRLLAEEYGIPETELIKDARFSDAEDSLAVVEWVMELEEKLESDA